MKNGWLRLKRETVGLSPAEEGGPVDCALCSRWRRGANRSGLWACRRCSGGTEEDDGRIWVRAEEIDGEEDAAEGESSGLMEMKRNG